MPTQQEHEKKIREEAHLRILNTKAMILDAQVKIIKTKAMALKARMQALKNLALLSQS